MKFILITNDPKLAQYAENSGVGRIFIDLEINGKHARQGHLDTVISQHSVDDIALVRESIDQAELLVRLNPLHGDTQYEIDQVIELGADLLMLPMFQSAQELAVFSSMVGGRVGIVPLVETYSAILDIENIAKVPGLSEIYIGLNDLHLDMGLNFMFQPLSNGLIEKAANIIKKNNIPFGFGGIARLNEGIVSGRLILAEHIRLGSSSVILSRTFYKGDNKTHNPHSEINLELEMKELFLEVGRLENRSLDQVEKDHLEAKASIENVARKISG